MVSITESNCNPKDFVHIDDVEQRSSSIRKAAKEYISHGYSPVPIPKGTKRPVEKGWPTKDYTETDFAGGGNIGLKTGKLLDVDCDCVEAVELAPEFMPETQMRHGRESAGVSHWWYERAGDVPCRRLTFSDPVSKQVLVELRGQAHQTMVPPSQHPETLEVLQWRGNRKPTPIETSALKEHVSRLAACSLLARHWPAQGTRDELAMALCGWLLRNGWRTEDTDHLVTNAARVGGDEEWLKRAKAEATRLKLDDGAGVTGWPRVAELIPKEVAKQIGEWLGLKSTAGVALLPDVEGLQTYPLTDAGNAEHFAHINKDRLKYDHLRKQWLVFRPGLWWETDFDGSPTRFAIDAARLRAQEAMAIDDLKEREKAWTHATRSENAPKLRATLELAQDLYPLADSGKDWDTNPDLLGVANGVVDLHTGELREGKPNDCITQHLSVPYNPDAKCPRFEQFVSEIFGGNTQLIEFLRLSLGYSLTGHTKEQCLFLLHGTGANGKSTLLELARWLLGITDTTSPFALSNVTRVLEAAPHQNWRLLMGGAS